MDSLTFPKEEKRVLFSQMPLFCYFTFVMSILMTFPVMTGAVSAVSEHCRGSH